MNEILEKIFFNFRSLLYPTSCPGCGRRVDRMAFCELCAPQIKRCEADVSSHRFKYINKVIYLCSYQGAVRKTLKDVKYRQKIRRAEALRDLIPPVAEIFRDAYFDMVVPVPLHRKRFSERGYNQTEVVFRYWAKNNGLPWVDLLTRTKGTAPQWQLLQQARRDNVRGVFFVGQPSVVKGANVLLVDDIFTSGATLEECAKSLKKSGAKTVQALTLAHGR